MQSIWTLPGSSLWGRRQEVQSGLGPSAKICPKQRLLCGMPLLFLCFSGLVLNQESLVSVDILVYPAAFGLNDRPIGWVKASTWLYWKCVASFLMSSGRSWTQQSRPDTSRWCPSLVHIFLYNILLPSVDCFLHLTLVPIVPSTTVSDAASDTGPSVPGQGLSLEFLGQPSETWRADHLRGVWNRGRAFWIEADQKKNWWVSAEPTRWFLITLGICPKRGHESNSGWSWIFYGP